jgi:hypothetical protein
MIQFAENGFYFGDDGVLDGKGRKGRANALKVKYFLPVII